MWNIGKTIVIIGSYGNSEQFLLSSSPSTYSTRNKASHEPDKPKFKKTGYFCGYVVCLCCLSAPLIYYCCTLSKQSKKVFFYIKTCRIFQCTRKTIVLDYWILDLANFFDFLFIVIKTTVHFRINGSCPVLFGDPG